MKELIKFEKYSRRDIHDIFSPNTIFTPQAGTWGLQGIIRVPDTVKDYIFLVTYGRSQGGHEFEENIDSNGVLIWQSQFSQGFDDSRIKDFINHDYLKNNIYLFLRTTEHDDYSYMGKLSYVEHDNQREKPVYFKWQILDWNTKENNAIENKLIMQSDDNSLDDNIDTENFTIILHEKLDSYQSLERRGKSTNEFNNRSYDFEGEAKKNTKLEMLVRM